MTTTKRKQPTESELRDLLFDSYLLGHMCGSQPLPFSVAAYEPTASQLLALRAAMAKGVHARRHMLSPSCSAPPVDLTRLLTKDEVAKEVERLLGQKLVELVVAVEPEQPELAAMTSQIHPGNRHADLLKSDDGAHGCQVSRVVEKTGPAALEEWPFGRSPRAG